MDEERYSRREARWEERASRREEQGRRSGGRSPGGGGFIVGGVIVAAGLVLLLDNLGIVHSYDIWQYWPLALVAVGVSRILQSRRPAALLWGGIMAAVGAVLFLDNLGIAPFRFHMMWPLIVIAVGISMLMKATDRSRLQGGGEPVDSDPTFSLFALFGGSKRRITTSDFRGGEAFAFCGGFHIDLRGAQMPSGRAVVDVNTIFGGCEIVVPDGWRVNVKAIGIFGGVEDKTIQPRPVEGVPIPELVLTGSALFGGMAVRN